MKKILIALPLIVVAAGCTSTKPLDMNLVAQQFYSQERSAKLLEMQNVSEFTIKGTNMTIAISTELQPLSIIPRDPSTIQALAETAGRVLVSGAGIYTAGQVMSKLADKPQVISQQVVKPEVITVPASP
jgi:hypothetical protein